MAAASSGSAENYNWHPLVHTEHFDETLHFVMIRLTEPMHVPVAQQIRTLLESAGIKYACEYTLFGWHDALIRVWLKPEAYRRLLNVLPPKANLFEVDRIHYLWLDESDLLSPNAEVIKKITGARDDIDTLARAPDSTDTTSWKKLHDKQLELIFDRPSNGRNVKFYTLLRSTSQTVPASEQIGLILDALNRTRIPKRKLYMSACSSVYCGKGDLASYLVRCTAPTYHDVLILAEQLDINLKEAQVRPMTLLVANQKPREFDHPNDPVHLSAEDRNLAGTLSVESSVIDDLNEHYRIELRNLVSMACNVAESDPDLRQLLLDLLRATVLNGKTAWYQSIIFLAHFEPLFRKYVERILELELGKGWRPQVSQKCEASSNPEWLTLATEMKKKKAQWSLGTYKFLARAAAKFYPAVEGQFENDLGVEWEDEVDSIHDLRNTNLHGRNYDQQLNAYDEKWAKELRRIINAAVLWRQLGGGVEGDLTE